MITMIILDDLKKTRNYCKKKVLNCIYQIILIWRIKFRWSLFALFNKKVDLKI